MSVRFTVSKLIRNRVRFDSLIHHTGRQRSTVRSFVSEFFLHSRHYNSNVRELTEVGNTIMYFTFAVFQVRNTWHSVNNINFANITAVFWDVARVVC
jgi:hypothetical protein